MSLQTARILLTVLRKFDVCWTVHHFDNWRIRNK